MLNCAETIPSPIFHLTSARGREPGAWGGFHHYGLKGLFPQKALICADVPLSILHDFHLPSLLDSLDGSGIPFG
ncbi:hypothetical protein [Pedobacter terrae]|uniref:hypothetical protein n=1 Tax=Pedobacter terrae TaxID=405671 RepID=UPI002FF4D954